MIRLLKSRSYDTKELIEISESLLEATKEERNQCYSSSERDRNSIRQAFFRQVTARLKEDLKREEKNTATQVGLF